MPHLPFHLLHTYLTSCVSHLFTCCVPHLLFRLLPHLLFNLIVSPLAAPHLLSRIVARLLPSYLALFFFFFLMPI